MTFPFLWQTSPALVFESLCAAEEGRGQLLRGHGGVGVCQSVLTLKCE